MIVPNNTNNLKEGKIFGFKLTTGEEIIAKIVSVSNTDVTLSKPHYLTQTPDGVAFAPALLMMSATADPVLNRSNIVMHFVPDTEFSSAYESAMSNIIAPKSAVIS